MIRFSLFVTAMLLAGAACAEGWRTYHNDRFGVTAAYPAGWRMGEEPANNDGRVFISPDGAAELTISGIRASASRAEEMRREAQPMDGETPTYSAKGTNWVVLSGTRKDGRIFYRKSLLSCGGQVWNHLVMEYPAQDKALYDGLVAHMAASLRAGPGYDISCN